MPSQHRRTAPDCSPERFGYSKDSENVPLIPPEKSADKPVTQARAAAEEIWAKLMRPFKVERVKRRGR